MMGGGNMVTVRAMIPSQPRVAAAVASRHQPSSTHACPSPPSPLPSLPPAVLSALQSQAAEGARKAAAALLRAQAAAAAGAAAGSTSARRSGGNEIRPEQHAGRQGVQGAGLVSSAQVALHLKAGVTRGLMAACKQHGVPVQQVGELGDMIEEWSVYECYTGMSALYSGVPAPFVFALNGEM